MPDRPAQRRKLLFAGRVQGVGFRTTAERIAGGLSVGGTVRNRDDGRVELIAEGDPAEIDRLVEGLQRHFGPGIESIDAEPLPPTGEAPPLRIVA